MTTNCKEELLNCISRYRGELTENKAGIKQAITHDKINNISDYFYQGGFVAWLPMRRCDVRDLRGKFENRHTNVSKFVNQVAF